MEANTEIIRPKSNLSSYLNNAKTEDKNVTIKDDLSPVVTNLENLSIPPNIIWKFFLATLKQQGVK
jgi:hypothetical protein